MPRGAELPSRAVQAPPSPLPGGLAAAAGCCAVVLPLGWHHDTPTRVTLTADNHRQLITCLNTYRSRTPPPLAAAVPELSGMLAASPKAQPGALATRPHCFSSKQGLLPSKQAEKEPKARVLPGSSQPRRLPASQPIWDREGSSDRSRRAARLPLTSLPVTSAASRSRRTLLLMQQISVWVPLALLTSRQPH